jgi:putative endonuclease
VSVERQSLGRRAEGLVAARLRGEGMTIVASNARPAAVRGEIDLVVRDGRNLVFVEVKARSIGSVRGPETPAMAVGPAKQARIRRLALAWLRESRPLLPGFAALRFDVVGVRLDGDGRIREWQHIRAAF